jgi:hypothetical protein
MQLLGQLALRHAQPSPKFFDQSAVDFSALFKHLRFMITQMGNRVLPSGQATA